MRRALFDRDRAEIEKELRSVARDPEIASCYVSAIGCAECKKLDDGRRYSVKRALKDMPLPNPRCTRKRCMCVWVYIMRGGIGSERIDLR